MPPPGWAEHDAEAIWWARVRRVARRAAGGGARRSRRGRGVSGIGPCVVPCDADDVPLRPAILYGVDTRAEPRDRRARPSGSGADAILERGGSRAVEPGARAEARVARAARARRVRARRGAGTWRARFVVARLTGEWVLDHHSASQCDPLYDLDGERLERGLGGAGRARPAAAAAAVARRGRRDGQRGGRGGDRPPGGDARRRGHDRRVGRGGQRRRPPARRPDAHVRLDDVPRRS